MKTNPIVGFFRSIAGKVTAVLALCILVLVLINWILNSFVLLGNYERQQGELLVRTYEQLNEKELPPHTLNTLLHRCKQENGIDAMVWSNVFLLYGGRPSDGITPPPMPLDMANGTYELSNRTPPHLPTGERWLTLSARTEGGLNVLLWVSLSTASSGAEMTNRFLLWSGIVTLLVGTVAALLLARSMTRPVRRLSAMAGHMAKLDFSERYSGEGNDELAELGRSLNTVSETMETTLSDLKTANLRLQDDMEAQTRQTEARTRFIRNVSHELKTPIALIRSYAEGLRENAVDDAESRAFYCEVIEDEAAKLAEILAKLTTLMQLEAGKEELVIERFDLRALIARLLERYAPLFGEKGVALPALSDEPCAAWGDALLIENVVTNYLTNALNHVSPDGRITVTLEPTERETVAVRVFNTGDPIPEEDLPHIWESFYKVDKAHTRSYGGTGIGLSVVAAIMNAHRMPFGVENADGGVCFFFELSTN